MPTIHKAIIKGLLADKGKTQTDAGAAIGINQGAFSARLNSGQFTDDEVKKLAKLLGVSIEDLLKTPGDKPGANEFVIKIELKGDREQLQLVKESLGKLLLAASMQQVSQVQTQASAQELERTGRTGAFSQPAKEKK